MLQSGWVPFHFSKTEIWVGTNHGLFSVSREDNFWTEFAIFGTIFDNAVQALASKDDSLVVTYGPDRKTAIYNIETGKWQ